MNTKFNKIKPIEKLDKIISKLDYLFDEFEKKNPEKIRVNCPFCNSDVSTIAFTYKNCNYCRCIDCDSIYLSPRITKEWLREYYSFMQEKFVFDIPESQRKVRIDTLMKPRWNLLYKKFKPFVKNFPVDRYMEVGPGVGYFTEVAQINKCANEYILVEPDVHCQAQLKKLGAKTKIFSSILENIDVNECGKVDIIFINSVIEHPFSISTFFSKLNEVLNDDGIVVLVDMHCNGLDIQALKENAPNINVYSILQIASIEGIKILSEKNGFEMKDVFSIGEMDADIIYEYLKGTEKNHPLKRLEKILSKDEVREDLQALLSKHLLTGYNGYIFKKK